jgi:hypothetical protein
MLHPRRLRRDNETSKKNPALPFFGAVDYPLTQSVVDLVARRAPELDHEALDYIRALKYDFHDFRRIEDRNNKSDVNHPSDLLEEDVRKWMAFRRSGQNRALMLYEGDWHSIGTNGRSRLAKPLEISEGHRNKDKDKDKDKDKGVVIGEHTVIVTENLPDGWKTRPWLNFVIIVDGFEMLGDAIIGAIWQPQRQQWEVATAGDIAAAGLTPLLEDFLGQLDASGLDVTCYIRDECYLTVHSVCISKTEFVTSAPKGIFPQYRVSLADFEGALALQVTDSDRAYRRYFESGIRRFANDMIVSDGMPSLDLAVNQLLGRHPDVLDAKRFGPEHSQGASQLQSVINALRKINAFRAIPVSIYRNRDVFGRNDEKPVWQPSPRGLDKDEFEALRKAYQLDQVSALRGAVWKQWEPAFLFKDKEPKELQFTVLHEIKSLPTDEAIEIVSQSRPEAAVLMRKWRKVWDKAFPEWQNDKRLRRDISASLKNRDRAYLRQVFRDGKANLSTKDISNIDFVLNRSTGDADGFVGRVINDACSVLSMSRCRPGTAMAITPSHSILSLGVDEEGLPLVANAYDYSSRNRFNDRILFRKLDYWHWPFLLRHFEKKIARMPWQPHEIALALLEMRNEGRSHAVLRAFESEQRWLINLEAGKTYSDFKFIVAKHLAGYESRHDGGLFVTEHINYKSWQRFFVVNGRVVGSIAMEASDCALDAPSRRLDERVSTINPDGHNESVVDRSAAAAMAQKARSVAADLRANGILECSFDIGLSERGPALCSLEKIDTAERFAFSPDRYVAAFERKRRSLVAPLQADVLARIERLVETPWLRQRSSDLLGRNLDCLPEIVTRQYDIMSTYASSSDQYPADFMEGVALSMILTAALETPPYSIQSAEEIDA